MFRRFRMPILMISMIAAAISMPAAWATGHSADNLKQLKPYYQKEGLDLGNYDKLLIDTLGLDNARVVAPPWIEGADASPQKWQLTASDVEWLRSSYFAAIQAEVGGSDGYVVVDQPGNGVVILDVKIVSLMPYARKNENVQVRGFGEMLVNAQLRDGASGELLAVYEGWQDVGSEYQQNTRLNAENDLRALFSVWGKRVRGLLDSSR